VWGSVGVGRVHVCAVRSDSTLWCWGFNDSGQLGTGRGNALSPTQVGGTDWQIVVAEGEHTCALRIDGTRWCWGSNLSGELGLGSAIATKVATPERAIGAPSSWASLEAGDFNTCGVDSIGGAWCWGASDIGQVGDGATIQRNSPTPVQLTGVPHISAVISAQLRVLGVGAV